MNIIHQNLIINKCSNDTIARAGNLFSYIDSDFENYGTDKKSPKTKETSVAVLEMSKNATFAQMFTKPDEMTLTQAQIIQFVKNHEDKLREDGYSTFFLFKTGDEFFVAGVYFRDGGRLRVHVRRFSYDDVWYAERRHRVVVPQLALKHFETTDTLTLGERCPYCQNLVKVTLSK